MSEETLKGIWMAGFHIARNQANDDWEDEELFDKWLNKWSAAQEEVE